MIEGTLITLVVLLAIGGIWIYNRLVRNRNLVNEAWAGIDVQLQKRHELVPSLVATVKGYVAHESDVLTEVARIRNERNAAVPALARRESALSGSLGRLFALAEEYPDLKANKGFQQLHANLVEIEDQLQYARRYYNGATRDNNNLVESFPANLIAKTFAFSQAEFFEIQFTSQRSGLSALNHIGDRFSSNFSSAISSASSPPGSSSGSAGGGFSGGGGGGGGGW